MANAVKLDDVIERAINGVKELQTKSPDELRKWLGQQQRLIPTHVPLPNAAHCLITEEGLKALHEFGLRWRDERPERKQRLDASAAAYMATKVFGEMLDGEAIKDLPPNTDAKRAFKDLLDANLEALSHEVEFSFPCRLFDDKQLQPFQVGPIKFLRRTEWLKGVADRALPAVPAWMGVVESLWAGRASPPSAKDFTARAIMGGVHFQLGRDSECLRTHAESC